MVARGVVGAARTVLAMVAELAALAESHPAHIATVRLLARVRVLVLVAVLLQTETLVAETTLHFLLRVVLLIVSLERELSRERCKTSVDVALENRELFRLAFDALLVKHHIVIAFWAVLLVVALSAPAQRRDSIGTHLGVSKCILHCRCLGGSEGSTRG